MDRERLPEQIEALHELTRICEEKDVSVVFVAGDVFDTYLPSAEAEETFFHAVKELAGKTRAVVVIPGNHDDGVRLAAAAPIAEEHGVYLFGSLGGHFSLGGDRPVKAVASGENHLILEDWKGEKLYINALPYPNEARLKEEKTEETYAQKIARWISCGEAAFPGGMPHILLSHLFVLGGRETLVDLVEGLLEDRAPVALAPGCRTLRFLDFGLLRIRSGRRCRSRCRHRPRSDSS